MKLKDLPPGTQLEDVSGVTHTLVAFLPHHPLYPYLSLVVWRREDGEWFHDALSGDLEASAAGRLIAADSEALQDNLRKALLHPSQRDAAPPSLSLVKPPAISEEEVGQQISNWMDGWRAAIEWLEERGELHLADTMRTRLPVKP